MSSLTRFLVNSKDTLGYLIDKDRKYPKRGIKMDDEKVVKIADVIAKQLELKNDISKKFVEEALHAIKTFDTKHTEKGLSKLDKFGGMGIIVKMDDKYESLTAYYNPETPPQEKAVVLKLWEDVAVYSLMGRIIENGNWK